MQFDEDQDEYLIFILIELSPEPVNRNDLLPLQDYFNSPAPYGRVSRRSPAFLTVFKPNGMCVIQKC